MGRTAADVLTAAIRTHVDTILGAQDAVRDDAPDAVHRCRLAVRRLRSLLRTFRPCFTAGTPAGLVEALGRWGAVLGDARDGEVQRDRVAVLARDLAPATTPSARTGLAALDDAVRRLHADAHARVVRGVGSPEHRALVRALHDLADDPPLRARARRRARPTLRPGLEREVERARRRASTLRDSDRQTEVRGVARPDPETVHRARKAARRARYTAEVLASWGSGRRAREAEGLAARHRALQDALGVVHDADVLAATLTGLRSPATADAVDLCLAVEARRASDAAEVAVRLARGLGPGS